MTLGKKGIFFTLAAIVLSIVIIFSFDVYTGYRLKEKMEVTEIRIDTMNNFIKNLENDIGEVILISGFRSLLSMEDYMMENNAATGAPYNFIDDLGFTDVDEAFGEAFEFGTLNSVKVDLMEDNTFTNWTTKMKDQAKNIDIILDFTVNSITITQSNPWQVDVTVNLDIDVQDKKNTASWTISKGYVGKINITTPPEDLPSQKKLIDPLYLVYTDGLANNTIRRTTAADFSTIANLQEHVDGRSPPTGFDGSFYIANTDAPSYLDRFEGILTESSEGIESLADVEKISGLGLGWLSTKTAVDHLYFVDGLNAPCNIVGMGELYDWFYLDSTGPNHKDDPYGGFNCV